MKDTHDDDKSKENIETPQCATIGCTRDVWSGGLCGACYQRERRRRRKEAGTPEKRKPQKRNPEKEAQYQADARNRLQKAIKSLDLDTITQLANALNELSTEEIEAIKRIIHGKRRK